MLVLSRKVNEAVVCTVNGVQLRVVVGRVDRDRVKLMFEGTGVRVLREEVVLRQMTETSDTMWGSVVVGGEGG